VNVDQDEVNKAWNNAMNAMIRHHTKDKDVSQDLAYFLGYLEGALKQTSTPVDVAHALQDADDAAKVKFIDIEDPNAGRVKG